MRRRSGATLGAVIAAAFVATVGCMPQPHVEVTSGTVESRRFSDHVEYYDLDLPANVGALEWVQLRDWDVNQILPALFHGCAGSVRLLRAMADLVAPWNPWLLLRQLCQGIRLDQRCRPGSCSGS